MSEGGGDLMGLSPQRAGPDPTQSFDAVTDVRVARGSAADFDEPGDERDDKTDHAADG